ncbi:hypothetical protein AJ85_13345 [Alkalihalobacillus alcalophilus ATCC 27647 = CGMCC 1.3604]|uniref:CAAX prenyl protease 2/Lysostaphin resistance protein A-like domain-containing protein n=1 Tax=Alkalihalobacillus alcalophilus ATCC 27647 = CGMCC 1.3604 TaxID=1218173 RepID=A0A094XKC0_ALKAL|nr:type II CAAX endopeptidase family protein [Alkalihalobacillus alcalophilus]KGA99185.1 hypothetical protein BALCAV_0200600 [Alkalihalobacillus alcalophilus ATCC 27647 = CGMCC 1.3604]MED1561272.1 type II CAAX endopeptidase family protein [Alkalihalobacillus alcalophilus]THG90100.1 hypothetical protein AJ85_13345 [Alkalihalobacillus alcalophilus ATCC 27647 = CGMCC 1.3604]
MEKQAVLVKDLTVREIVVSVYFTQLFLLFLATVLSFFLFNQFSDWLLLFKWDIKAIFGLGFIVVVIAVVLNVGLSFLFSKEAMDDGGINEKLFKGITIPQMIVLCLVISLAEELFFRGVLQTTFGLVVASLVFAGLHFRYLRKPVLFLGVVVLSFLIGLVYMWTGNLWVTIFIHFLIDLALGLIIKFELIKGGTS